MVKVSVIIPTYNRAQFIAETIQSVLDQTFSDFEIIVVDDGSTDNTKQVIDGFKDPRIKYIYQENQWAAIARNTGIKASKGVYLTFLDSDDALTKNALLRGINILDKHPEAGFTYSPTYMMDESGQVLGLQKRRQKYSRVQEGKELIREFLISGHHVGVCGTIVRRSCLDEVGFWDPSFRHGSVDFDLLVRLAKRYGSAYIHEPAGRVRVHSNSIIHTRAMDEYEKAHRRIVNNIFSDPEVGQLFTPLRAEAYFRLNLRFAASAFRRREMKTARGYLYKALKTYPKEFLKGLWISWIIQYIKTWIPTPLVLTFQRTKRYLSTGH